MYIGICFTIVQSHLLQFSKQRGADVLFHHSVEFESGDITLDVPTIGVEVNGWNLRPFGYPMVCSNKCKP